MTNSELSNTEKIEGLLHDVIAPHFLISQQQIELLMTTLDKKTLSEHQQAMLIKSWRSLSDGLTTMGAVMAACRNTAHEKDKDLAPLDDEALFPRVEDVLTQYKPLLDLTVQTHGEISELMANKRLGICLQELLTNALKHSPKDKVTIDMRRHGDLAKITVTSLGTNFINSPGETAGTGLERMRHRIALWGGDFCVDQKNSNFQVVVAIPIG